MPALLVDDRAGRRAGHQEFTDAFVQAPEMQDMQRRTETHQRSRDRGQGMDVIRSRIEITLKDGAKLIEWATSSTAAGRNNPMSDKDLESKVAACTAGILRCAAGCDHRGGLEGRKAARMPPNWPRIQP